MNWEVELSNFEWHLKNEEQEYKKNPCKETLTEIAYRQGQIAGCHVLIEGMTLDNMPIRPCRSVFDMQPWDSGFWSIVDCAG